jgi:hypothetical protein
LHFSVASDILNHDYYEMDTMIYSIAGMLSLIAVGTFALQLLLRLRAMETAAANPQASGAPANVAGRYRPLLRLLGEEDFGFVAGNPTLLRALRTERRKLFRSYLSCLTKEYGRLLAGVRLVMVQSRVDRPDLARSLAKNRILFAFAICRIEYRLAMQTFGLGKVDISGLVEAFDRLRESAIALQALPTA